MGKSNSFLGLNTSKITEALFQVRPQELERTVLLAGMAACASAIQILARTARDTLFLSRFDPSYLPWMFIAYGAASVVVATALARAGRRFRPARMLRLSLLVTAVTYCAVYGLVLADLGFVYPVLYVWADVTSGLIIVQVWGVASSLHTPADAKRLYGAIGAGGIVGMVTGGLGSGALVSSIGTGGLLLVAAVLCGAIDLLAARVRRFPEPSRTSQTRSGAPVSRRYIRVLSALLIVTFTVAQIADYQFKLVARGAFDEIALARYFSLFYAGVGVFALLFQLVATPRILERWGVLSGLSFMPALMGVGSLAILALPSVASATVLKFGDAGFQFTINNSSLQLLYLPFPPSRKARLLLMLEGLMKPIGYAVGGATLILGTQYLSLPMLSLISAPLVFAWIWLAMAARKGYISTLARSLEQRRFVPLGEAGLAGDRGTIKMLRDALDDEDTSRALFAAEQLLTVQRGGREELIADLLSRSIPEMKVLALREIAARRLESLSGAAVAELQHPAPRVRAAAVEAVASARHNVLGKLAPLLEDSSGRVREAAAIGLLRSGSREEIVAAGTPVLSWARSEKPRERVRAARVLGASGNPGFARPLGELLADPDKQVRRSACEAAQRLPAAPLIESLVAAAHRPGSRAAAAMALRSYGDEAVEPIRQQIQAAADDPEARRHLTKALRGIGTPRALEVLVERLSEEEDSRVRRVAWKSVDRLVVRGGLPLPGGVRLRGLIRQELIRLYTLAQGYYLVEEISAPLLSAAVRRALGAAQGLVLRALEVRYRMPALAAARKRINARQLMDRANAKEILATVLDREDRRLVLPYFEPVDARERSRLVSEFLEVELHTPTSFLSALARRGDDWLRVCAFFAAATQGIEAVREGAKMSLQHRNPQVRAAAALALAALDGRPQGKEEVEMRDLLETVILLKGVSLFSEVPGDDLAALVQTADEVRFKKDEVIIREGEPGDTLFVVVSGQVRVEKGEATLVALRAGECFGELSVLDQEPRSATVVADEDVELLAVSQEDFHELLADHPELASAVLRVMSRRLRAASGGAILS